MKGGKRQKSLENTALIGFVLYIFAQLETHEPTDFNLFAQLADILADDVLHQAIRVAHPRLLVFASFYAHSTYEYAFLSLIGQT